MRLPDLAYFVYPPNQGKSSLLKFESFIVLPQGSALNILDYLSVSNDALFVAGLSQKNLFKIDLFSLLTHYLLMHCAKILLVSSQQCRAASSPVLVVLAQLSGRSTCHLRIPTYRLRKHI